MKQTLIRRLPKAFVSHLQEDVVLEVGELQLSRQDMIERMKCGNFIAAARLTKALKKLKVTTPKQLFDLGPFSLWNMKGVGMSQVYVAMCLLDSQGYSVAQWWNWQEPTRRSKQEVLDDARSTAAELAR